MDLRVDSFVLTLAVAVLCGTALQASLLWQTRQVKAVSTLLIQAVVVAAGLLGAKGFAILLSSLPASELLSPTMNYRYPGGLVGVALAIPLVRRILPARVTLAHWLDCFAPTTALVIAILRLDCLVVGCCGGGVCHLPWAMSFAAGTGVWKHQVAKGLIGMSAAESLPVHPLQIYFLLLALCVGALTLWALARKRRDGQVIFLFLATHEAGKFLLEYFRTPALPSVQAASLVLTFIGLAGLVLPWLRARRRDG